VRRGTLRNWYPPAEGTTTINFATNERYWEGILCAEKQWHVKRTPIPNDPDRRGRPGSSPTSLLRVYRVHKGKLLRSRTEWATGKKGAENEIVERRESRQPISSKGSNPLEAKSSSNSSVEEVSSERKKGEFHQSMTKVRKKTREGVGDDLCSAKRVVSWMLHQPLVDKKKRTHKKGRSRPQCGR